MTLALMAPAERRTYLGASDAPIVAGVSPWGSEYALASLKRGLSEPGPENAAMRWGNRIEQVVADIYEEETGERLRRVNRLVRHPAHPFIACHPDREVVGKRRLVEIKTSRRGWDEVPRHVTVQVQHQMACTGAESVDVALLRGYGEVSITTVPRDDALIADLIDLEASWWARYVEGDEMPPLDGSREATRALDGLRGPAEMRADEDQSRMLRSLRVLRKGVADLEASEAALVRRIKGTMAGGGLLTGDGFRVLWSPVKGKTTTNWRAVADGLRTRASDEEWDAIVSLATTVGEGGTTFRPVWRDDEEGAA